MTPASTDGAKQPAEDESDASRSDNCSVPHPGTLPTERESATRLILSDGDAGRVTVHWRVAAPDLRHLRSVFPHDVDPAPVIRLIRLSESGGTELVERVPLSDADLLSEGDVSFDIPGGRVAVQAELGLETPAGGWLLLVRSTPVTDAAEIIAEAPDVASPTPAPLHVEPALVATGADLVPVFPEVNVAAARQGTVTNASAATDASVAPSAFTSAPVIEADSRSKEPLSATDRSVQDALPPRQESTGDVGVQRAAQTDEEVDQGQQAGATSSPASTAAHDDAAFPAERPRSSSYGISEPRHGADEEGAELHTELLVHGRASPGSAIDLFGHRIQVGSGGRFSLRLPVSNSQLLQQALDQGMPLAIRRHSDS